MPPGGRAQRCRPWRWRIDAVRAHSAAHRSRRRGAQAGSASGPPQALMPAPVGHLRPGQARLNLGPLRALPPCMAARGPCPWGGAAGSILPMRRHALPPADAAARAGSSGGDVLPGRAAWRKRMPAASGAGGGLRLASGAFPPAHDLRFGPRLLHFFSGPSPFSSPPVFRLLPVSHCF